MIAFSANQMVMMGDFFINFFSASASPLREIILLALETRTRTGYKQFIAFLKLAKFFRIKSG